MLLRIKNLVIKEFIQLRRDRIFITFILLFPAVQLSLIAQSTSRGWNHLPIAIWDQDHSTASRQLITALDVTEELDVRYHPRSLAEANVLLTEGKATMVVVIPAGFSRDLTRPTRPPQVQIIVDGTNNILASTALGTAEGAITEFVRRLTRASPQFVEMPIELRAAVRFNPAMNVQYQAIPAQMGFIIYEVVLVVAATMLARERELGTLEQLAVTPLSRFELITGKAIPAAVLGLLNFAFMLGVMVYGFHVPMRGSLLLLFGVTLLFIAVEIGWGMLISAISRTQQQAILLVFIVAMTDVSLSGYMVPVKNMPAFLQAISILSALRHYLAALRAIALKGAGLSAIWPEVMALAGLAVAAGMASLALARSRWD
ncbi:MAG: ABC transporter permease [Anaerolineae bacterium]|nr:ABC transporter permease [Anaerolineae bacterium]MDW8098009.1 ABC transporter permease [Anaerolineae bacterium]